MELYNLFGGTVPTLVDEKQEAGHKLVIRDASNISSRRSFSRLAAGDYTETKKILLLKQPTSANK